jgi:hypothetical protein
LLYPSDETDHPSHSSFTKRLTAVDGFKEQDLLLQMRGEER